MVRDRFEERKTKGKHRSARRQRQRFTVLLMAGAVTLCLAGAALAYGLWGTNDTHDTDQKTATAAGDAPASSETQNAATGGDNTVAADPSSGYGQLVNRSHPLKNAETYEPDDLVEVAYAYNGNGQLLRKDAAEAMEALIAAFKADYPDLPIYTKSGYRSYALQNTYYTNQISVYGDAYEAATISAIPGTSEHELGLAMDLTIDGSLTAGFEETTQGQWFLAHCNDYGYIHRYPKGSELMTGIIYEPWHFRYVGKEIAADMAAKNVSTLEEYYGLYLDAKDIDNYVPFLQ